MLKSEVYSKLNEGLGGCYERIAYTNIIKRIAEEYKCRSILELNATYIAGVPGFNSCLLAQAGYDVTVAVMPRDYEDTLKVWELTGLKADIVKISRDIRTPFLNGEFDMVWNHLAFEQHWKPTELVEEMARIAGKVVINLTLSPFNYGFLIHWLGHRLNGKAYDHGYARNATIGAMVKAHRACGLEVFETGGCDAPPWMDTVDAKIGDSMTYLDIFPKPIRDRWIWCSANPKCQEHRLVKLLWSWEKAMPDWFRKLFAHHLYVASRKGKQLCRVGR